MIEPETVRCPRCGNEMSAGPAGGLCPRCAAALLQAEPTEFAGETGPHGTKILKQPPTPEELAAKFPQLEILGLLGRGGMGAVYKARQKELGRIVALKILPPGVGVDPAFADRFTREAQALAQLNHPGIVTLYEFGRADGLFYFLMEFVDGVSLRRLLAGGRISSREALAIVPQICDALQYAHDQGIVHRDIKPENVLMDRRGRVKVADFGLAKIVGTDALTPSLSHPMGEGGAPTPGEGSAALTEAGKIMGTPQYMSPEQIEAPGEVDHRADIYALGVVFYQMLTGELPGKKIEPPSRKVAIDVRLDEVVLRALEEKPALRYQQASILKTQVETIASTPPGGRPARRDESVRSDSLGHQENRSQLTSAATKQEPRFSRTAIVGAVWAILLVPLLFMVRIEPGGLEDLISVEIHASGMRNWPVWVWLLFGVSLIGLSAPFAATILGWIAISQIRRSAGRLHGMWLAVFDGLLFPLLALNAMIVGGVILGIGSYLKNWWLVLAAVFVCILIDWLIIRRVWNVVKLPPSELQPQPSLRASRSRRVAWAAVLAVVIALVGLIAVPNLLPRRSTTTDPAEFAENPSKLRGLSTVQLIQAGLARPDRPWVWQELKKRPLSSDEIARIMDGLVAWMRQEYPRGCENPLPWLDRMLEDQDNRPRLNDEQKVRFLVALHGDLRIDPVARMREGDYQLSVCGECRYIWRHDFLGYSMMNAPLSVTVNGEPVKTEHNFDRDWSVQNLCVTLFLSSLPPGTHRVTIEVLSALASKQDLAGLLHNAPPADWPPARKRWTRTAEVELVIHPQDAVIVSQTSDPALDPLRDGSLAVNPVLIRSRGDRAQAVLNFGVANTLPVPISFDVMLHTGDQTISFGNLWAIQTPTGSSSSGTDLTVEVDRLPPDIRSADVVLTPNPRPVEQRISFDQIWGRDITFRGVRLIRQDLGEAAPGGSG
jgi:serine/threonine protein kinase